MKNRYKYLLIPLVGVFLILGSAVTLLAEKTLDDVVADVKQRYPDVKHISADELASQLRSDKKPVLLDSRSMDEFEVSHIEGAQWIDPDNPDVAGLKSKYSAEEPVVVYCAVGWRSATVTDQLMAAGFTNVQNLEGSIFRWVEKGYPVVRDGQPVKEVHPYNSYWGRLLPEGYRS